MTFSLNLVKRMIELKKKYAKKDFIIGYRFSPEEIENPGNQRVLPARTCL